MWNIIAVNKIITWETYVATVILGFIAYLIGSILFAKVLLWMKGDKEPLYSYGATAASTRYGAKGFAFVFIGDLLKAVLAFGILWPIYLNVPFFGQASFFVALSFVVLGHALPIFNRFSGGKGISTAFGFALVLNWFIAIFAIAVYGLWTWRLKGKYAGVGTSLSVVFYLTIFLFIPFFPESLVPLKESLEFGSLMAMTGITILTIIMNFSAYRNLFNKKTR